VPHTLRIPLNLITRITFGEKYRSRSFSSFSLLFLCPSYDSLIRVNLIRKLIIQGVPGGNVSVILSKESVYIHVSYSERFPR
jgi:hypothetical protein